MKKNMDCRGLDSDCFDMIRKDEGLQALLDHIKGDHDCCLEVRCNYLSCYYRGGSMLKLEFNLCQKNLTFTFDPQYLDLKKTSKEPFAQLEAWLKIKSKDPRQWLDRLEALKGIMDAWFAECPAETGKVQYIFLRKLPDHGYGTGDSGTSGTWPNGSDCRVPERGTIYPPYCGAEARHKGLQQQKRTPGPL